MFLPTLTKHQKKNACFSRFSVIIFLLYERIGCISSTIKKKKKKEKNRKADKLRANDLPVRKNTYPVYYLKGYTG